MAKVSSDYLKIKILLYQLERCQLANYYLRGWVIFSPTHNTYLPMFVKCLNNLFSEYLYVT